MFHIIKLSAMFICTIILSSWAVQKQVPQVILVMGQVWDPMDYLIFKVLTVQLKGLWFYSGKTQLCCKPAVRLFHPLSHPQWFTLTTVRTVVTILGLPWRSHWEHWDDPWGVINILVLDTKDIPILFSFWLWMETNENEKCISYKIPYKSCLTVAPACLLITQIRPPTPKRSDSFQPNQRWYDKPNSDSI